MEIAWIVAGIIVGGVVVWFAAPKGNRTGAMPEAETLATRVKSLEADVERLRLDFHDTLDKIEHLYGRIRKRIQFTEEPKTNGPTVEPALSGKAAIRARARLGGLLK